MDQYNKNEKTIVYDDEGNWSLQGKELLSIIYWTLKILSSITVICRRDTMASGNTNLKQKK